LAIPYWIGITAYLKSQQWLTINDGYDLQAYLLGVVLGALSFFMIIAYLATKAAVFMRGNSILKYIPAATLLILGIYGLINSFL
ncbi:MAG: hypothetical protein O9262_12825, partial [Cyclobacteriaceae bacterium]|nr:hypothetical protein [Cyclobacteriaceae bacterium]